MNDSHLGQLRESYGSLMTMARRDWKYLTQEDRYSPAATAYLVDRYWSLIEALAALDDAMAALGHPKLPAPPKAP